MNTNIITAESQIAFTLWLKSEEKATATIEKYGRDVTVFAAWLDGAVVTKETAADYKKHLLGIGRMAIGVNAVIAGLTRSFISWVGT